MDSGKDFVPLCQQPDSNACAYAFMARYLIICPSTWEIFTSRVGVTIGASRSADLTGEPISNAFTASSVMLHEMLHAATAPALPGGGYDAHNLEGTSAADFVTDQDLPVHFTPSGSNGANCTIQSSIKPSP